MLGHLVQVPFPLAYRDQTLQRLHLAGRIVLEKEFVRVLAERFRSGPAIQRLRAPVPVENPLLHVRDANRVLRLVEQRGLLPDLLLGVLALGHIAGDDNHVCYPAVLVPHPADLRFDVAKGAVLEQKTEFGALPNARGNHLAKDPPNPFAVFRVYFFK